MPTGTITQGGVPLPSLVGTVFSVALAPMIAGDERQNALWTYSELNPRGPLAGKQRDGRAIRWDIIFATSVGIESLRVFTGHTLGTSTTTRSRTLTLTALDNRELFRNATSLPFLVGEWFRPVQGETLPYMPGLETTWLISYLLGRYPSFFRETGFYAAPPPHPGVMCYVPCHGSLHAFIGDVLYAFTERASGRHRQPMFDTGPYVGATEKAPIGGRIAAKWAANTSTFYYNFGAGARTIGRIEFYLKLDTIGTSLATLSAVNIDDATTYVTARIASTGLFTLELAMAGVVRSVTGPAVAAVGAWHAYGVHWDSSTGSASFRIDNTTTVVAFTPLSGTTTTQFADISMEITDLTQIAEIHYTGGFPIGDTTDQIVVSSPWVWENFSATAFIDRSQNRLVGVVYDQTDDEWATLTAIAQAEFAAVYFDQLGYPHYNARVSNVTDVGQAVTRSLTATNSLINIDYVANITQIANDVTVAYTVPELRLNQVVWSPSSPVVVYGFSTITIPFAVPGQLFPLEPISYIFTTVNTAPDGSGTALSTFPLIVSVGASNFAGTVTIENTSSTDVWLVDSTGAASFTLYASYIVSGSSSNPPAHYIDEKSVARHKTQLLSVSASPWRQSFDSCQTIAVWLLSDLGEIAPVLRNIVIVGDPRLQIGDRIRLTELTNLGVDDRYRITGISPSVDSSGAYTQTLIARATSDVAYWNVNRWNDGTVWGA
ncbi:MAG: hypothetical protein A2Y75_05370 [Candidatus Solincola sediminis]|uniref:Uncharacterized protein n=1 Tax=Candidatus Solincola sediminis TaxID=1797199 RepID=A0A1F2WG59_9ACTN|nr:MAG: hypothetical protein A2Y75_05370 [Candidatus Solincola sediminis]